MVDYGGTADIDTDLYVFFFSSRRRHTRCGRDWSSDVCSSDLVRGAGASRPAQPDLGLHVADLDGLERETAGLRKGRRVRDVAAAPDGARRPLASAPQQARARI